MNHALALSTENSGRSNHTQTAVGRLWWQIQLLLKQLRPVNSNICMCLTDVINRWIQETEASCIMMVRKSTGSPEEVQEMQVKC